MTETLAAAFVAVIKSAAPVAAIAGTRIYPDSDVPEGASVPYVVYSELSTVPEESQAECNGLDGSNVEFACYADTTREAIALRKALRDALTPPGAVAGAAVTQPTQRTLPADELRLANAILELTFYHNPSA